jgi:RNA polymerase sigma-70 factor (ECF subfamily)
VTFRRGARRDDDAAGRRLVASAVRRAKRGDSEAVRFLYVWYADRVYGYVCSIVRDEHEAEDVTQHVFAKLMIVIPKFREGEGLFDAWLLRVARNVAIEHVRRRRAVLSEDGRELEGVPVDSDAQLRSLALRDALAALPGDQCEVLVLRHLVGLSPAEIAVRLGRSSASVWGLHHRAARSVRAELTAGEAMPSVA